MDLVRILYSSEDSDFSCRAFREFVDDLQGAVVTSMGLLRTKALTLRKCRRIEVRSWQRSKDQRRVFEICLPTSWFASGVGVTSMSILVANAAEFGCFRLEGIHFPAGLLKTFCGPPLGINGVRLLLGKRKGVIFAAPLKPNIAQSLEDKMAIAEELAAAGVDIIKDDEISIWNSNDVICHAAKIQARIDKYAQNGHRPCYVPNISGEDVTEEHIRFLAKSGIRGVMLTFLLTGWGKLRQLAMLPEWNTFLYGHRAGYPALEPFVSMPVIATLGRITGIDLLHVGTPQPDKDRLLREVSESVKILQCEMDKLKPSIPVFSKTTPELAQWIKQLFGSDIVLMACGAIYGNDRLEKTAREWIQEINSL